MLVIFRSIVKYANARLATTDPQLQCPPNGALEIPIRTHNNNITSAALYSRCWIHTGGSPRALSRGGDRPGLMLLLLPEIISCCVLSDRFIAIYPSQLFKLKRNFN